MRGVEGGRVMKEREDNEGEGRKGNEGKAMRVMRERDGNKGGRDGGGG
jgi:hypothetical protein